LDGMILTIFLSLLGISILLIIITLLSLPQLGDERRNLIKMKAQSFTFTAIIGYVFLEFGGNIYRTIWGSGSYEGINPFTFLVTFSLMYLTSLLFFKKKYGD
jgi:hypothetical protein